MEHDSARRKAEEIAEQLRQEIVGGALEAGSKILAERELAGEFSTSRVTAREAVQMLEAEGLVVRHGAKGTFVAKKRGRTTVDRGREIPSELTFTISAPELRTSGSSLRVMERPGSKPYTKCLEQPALVVVSEEVAGHLKLPEGSLVLRCYRLQGADDQPYRLIESYHPSDLFGELLTVDIGDKPLFMWLQARHNLKVVRARESLIARLPERHEWSLLRISPHALVMEIERILVVEDTLRPIEWARVIAVAHLHKFAYEYVLDEGKEYGTINPAGHSLDT